METKVTSIQTMASKGICQIVELPKGKGAKPTIASEVLDFYGRLATVTPSGDLSLGFCVFRKRPLEVEELERHMDSQELLFAVDDDFLIMAALNDMATGTPDLNSLTVARVRRSSGVIFHPGVWHGVPFPFKEESFALVGFGTHTTDSDMHFHTCPERIRIVI